MVSSTMEIELGEIGTAIQNTSCRPPRGAADISKTPCRRVPPRPSSIAEDNYQKKVHDPHMQRLLAEKEREAKDYAEVKARFDREKDFIEAQKN